MNVIFAIKRDMHLKRKSKKAFKQDQLKGSTLPSSGVLMLKFTGISCSTHRMQ